MMKNLGVLSLTTLALSSGCGAPPQAESEPQWIAEVAAVTEIAKNLGQAASGLASLISAIRGNGADVTLSQQSLTSIARVVNIAIDQHEANTQIANLDTCKANFNAGFTSNAYDRCAMAFAWGTQNSGRFAATAHALSYMKAHLVSTNNRAEAQRLSSLFIASVNPIVDSNTTQRNSIKLVSETRYDDFYCLKWTVETGRCLKYAPEGISKVFAVMKSGSALTEYMSYDSANSRMNSEVQMHQRAIDLIENLKANALKF